MQRLTELTLSLANKLALLLATYLDDLLFCAGGLSFVLGGHILWGTAGALFIAGLVLTVAAFLVARSRGGGQP